MPEFPRSRPQSAAASTRCPIDLTGGAAVGGNGQLVGTIYHQGALADPLGLPLPPPPSPTFGTANESGNTTVTLAPGTYSVRFLARENSSGKMGTFETKFVVPDLALDQRYLPISSVVLSYQREKLDAAVASAERDKKLIAANPVVQNGEKLVPSVTRVFRQQQDLQVYLEAYEPGAEKTQPLTATVSFYRGKVKMFEAEPVRVAEGLNAKSKAVPVRFQVPLGKLQPGKYTCQVSVMMPSAQRFAVWRSSVVLLP